MPSFSSGALLGVVLSIVLTIVGGWGLTVPSRTEAPGRWGRFWVRVGLLTGLGGLLGTTVLVSGYWVYVGPPPSMSEMGSELARQTLGNLANPAFLALVGGSAFLFWVPTRLYGRMSETAVLIHVAGTLAVWLGLTAVYCGFVGVPPIPKNAQAGVAVFLYSIVGFLLYLLVLGATAIGHVSSAQKREGSA